MKQTIEDKLQEALETAEQLKDDLVPLALEYYLGVIDVAHLLQRSYPQ